jgi:hypothetical protein
MIRLLLFACVLQAAESNYVRSHGSAWRLALGDLDGDGRRELIYGTYEGAVRALDTASGRERWSYALPGFPFAVAAADLTGDGRAEVLAATAAGTLEVLSPEGKPVWKYRSDRPLFDVAVGRAGSAPFVVTGGPDRIVQVLNARGERVAQHRVEQLVHRLAAADFDRDGVSEILVLDNRNTLERLRLKGGQLVRDWRKPLTVPDRFRNWENPGARFFAFSIECADLTGDGIPEIVMGDSLWNKQPVAAFSAEAEQLWITPPVPSSLSAWSETRSADNWYDFYSAALVRIAEIRADSPGPEVIAVTGANLRVISAQGKVLERADTLPGFADLAVDGGTLWLGSTPGGDDTLYRLPLDKSLARTFAALERRGSMRVIGENLERLRTQVLAAPARPSGGRKYRVYVGSAGSTEAAAQRSLATLEWYRKRFPYPNLEFTMTVKVIEPEPPLDERGQPWSPSRWKTDSINGTQTVDQIVDIARRIERLKIPTMFNIGHSCMPFITLATAEKILQVAPNYTVGFKSAEDEDPNLFPRFAKHYLEPLARIARRYGDKRIVTKNKGIWWFSMPSQPEVFDALLAGDTRRQLVAETEDSNSRTPEINLMSRIGLRQAGLVRAFNAAVIQDSFSFNRYFEWEYPRSGHPFLRQLAAFGMLGAEDFELRLSSTYPKEGGMEFNRLGRESIEIFLHLLGKGLIVPPRPDEMAHLSPVGFAVHPPPAKWIRDGHNGHAPQLWEPDAELDNAVIPHNGCLWGMTPTPPQALQRVLFGKQRQFGFFLPPTPWGAVAFVPARAALDKVVGVTSWWHTDGIRVWRQGEAPLTGTEAARAVAAGFERAAAALLVRPSGDPVHLQVTKADAGRYRLLAVDPGWVDPQTRTVTLRFQNGARDLRDALSGEAIPITKGTARLVVPAGSLRLLEFAR